MQSSGNASRRQQPWTTRATIRAESRVFSAAGPANLAAIPRAWADQRLRRHFAAVSAVAKSTEITLATQAMLGTLRLPAGKSGGQTRRSGAEDQAARSACAVHRGNEQAAILLAHAVMPG